MSSSSFHSTSLLSYEFTILKVKNLELDLPSPENLFIRYYFKSGSGKLFRVDTKSISCNSVNSIVSLNHKALFECRVNSMGDSPSSFAEDIRKKKKCVKLELRWRRKGYSVFGLKMAVDQSKVLARVEVPWREDLGERWVRFEKRSRGLRGKKEIEVLVGFRVWEEEEKIRRKEMIECDCERCRFGWKGGDEGDDVCF